MANDVSAPSEIYCGRAYQEAARAAGSLSAELVVISAGLGLVRESDSIPSYSLTVAPGKQDTIQRKLDAERVSPEVWWGVLRQSKPAILGLRGLFQKMDAPLVLLSLSANYARLIKEELSGLADDDVRRLRIFGAGIGEYLPTNLSGSVMPYDARFNGPKSPLKGAMSDFGSRALHHYSQCLLEGTIRGLNASQDHADLSRLMSDWVMPETPVRKKLSDKQVIDFILENWQKTEGRSGFSHRLLRGSGFACEQGRFRDLFKRARLLRETRVEAAQ